MYGTAHLPDIDQRQEPIELIGMVIGTAGTPAYVHLQLEVARRMFGKSLPTLIVNDGDSFDELKPLAKLADEYGAELQYGPQLGHSVGDVRAFVKGMEWSKANGLSLMVKLSRRFIPLVSWRHGLQVLAAENPNVSVFTRRHNDRSDGLFRTDAIAIRVAKFDNEKTQNILAETLTRPFVNVEPMFESLSRMNGGWAMWDLLGPNFYRPYAKAMQWRGLLPYHYGDLSRELGLPYEDADFGVGRFMTEVTRPTDDAPAAAMAMKVNAPSA